MKTPSLWYRLMVRVSSTALWAFLGCLTTRYIGHSRSKWAGTGSDSCYGYPKIPLGHMCETDYASPTKYRLIRPSNVNGTGTQLTTKSSSSPLPLRSAIELSGDFNLLELVPRIKYSSIISDVV